MRSEEIWTDTHSIKMNQISTKITEFLFFLNLHLFYRYITERFFHWYGFNPPPKKILNPYCFLSHFVKEILKDWKWKFCTRYIEFQSGCIFWHPYMQRKIKLLTSIKAFITAVAEGHTSPKPPCTGIQAVIDINGLVWLE